MLFRNVYEKGLRLGHALEVINEEVNQDVDVYFIGMSNGAILGARFGHSHLEIKRMLLINGPLMINWPQTKKGLEKFEGECVTMVYGSFDPSYKYAEMVEFIDNPGKIRLVKCEGADHNFRNNAVLDRLLHHSSVISIKGPSYRLKDKRAFLEAQEAET